MPDKDTLEEIRHDLLAAGYSQKWIDLVFPDKRVQPDSPRDRFISWLEAGECSHADTLFLYDQLRYLLQQLEWWEQAAETQKENNLQILSQLQQSREENERLHQQLKVYEGCKGIEDYYTVRCKLWECQTENERLRGDLEQVKAERDDYRKVLDWYAGYRFDDGEKARSILSRYPSERGE